MEVRSRSTENNNFEELTTLHHILNTITHSPLHANLHKTAPHLMSMVEKNKADRIKGSFLGLSVGDAIGGSYKFIPNDKVIVGDTAVDMIGGGEFSLEAGQWTDETSQALCVGASLLIHGYVNGYDQLLRYVAWRDHGYFSSQEKAIDVNDEMDKAITTFKTWWNDEVAYDLRTHPGLKWVSEFFQASAQLVNEPLHRDLASKAENQAFSQDTLRNAGVLVRAVPIAIFFHDDASAAIEHAAVSTMTTNDNTITVDASKYYVTLLWEALNGRSKEYILSEDLVKKHPGLSDMSAEVLEIAKGSYKKNDRLEDLEGYRNESPNGALKAALWALYNDDNDFESGVSAATRLGGSTDSVVGIYGALAGALYGLSSIPSAWSSRVFGNEFIGDMAMLLSVRRKMVVGVPSVTKICVNPAVDSATIQKKPLRPAKRTSNGVKQPSRSNKSFYITILIVVIIVLLIVGIFAALL